MLSWWDFVCLRNCCHHVWIQQRFIQGIVVTVGPAARKTGMVGKYQARVLWMCMISYISCRFQLLVLKNGKSSNKVGNEKASHLFCWYEEVISHRYLVVEIWEALALHDRDRARIWEGKLKPPDEGTAAGKLSPVFLDYFDC